MKNNYKIPPVGYSSSNTHRKALPSKFERKLSQLLTICFLFVFFQVLCVTTASAYDNEVRALGNSYVYRIGGVDKDTVDDLSTAINRAIGWSKGAGREIHILTGGELYSTINFPANVKVYFHKNTFTTMHWGIAVRARYVANVHVYDMNLNAHKNFYVFRFTRCDNAVLSGIHITGGGIGMRLESSTSREPWKHTFYNLTVTDCIFEYTSSHGLETFSVDTFNISGIIARYTGECGVLLNTSRNGTVGSVYAYRSSYRGGYAGLRFANSCYNIVADKLIARECGRGYFVLSGSNNCHLNNAIIIDCVDKWGWGRAIWLENVENCSVKSGCCNTGVTVSGAGSYVNVSTDCDDIKKRLPIENGTYVIKPSHSGLCIAATSPLHQQACDSTAKQIWKIFRKGNTYTLYAVLAKKYVSLTSTAAGSQAILSDNPATLFNIINRNDGTFQLALASDTTLVLTVGANSAVTLARNTYASNQIFTFDAVKDETDCAGDWAGAAVKDACSRCVGANTGEVACDQSVVPGVYYLKPEASGLCITAAADSVSVKQENCIDSDAQVWHVSRSGGLYEIFNRQTQKFLGYTTTTAGTQLTLTTDRKRYLFMKSGRDSTLILHPSSDLSLAVELIGNPITVGQGLQLAEVTKGGNQLFKFQKVTTNLDCAGTWKGSAYLDSCGGCAGGTSGHLECALLPSNVSYKIRPLNSNLCLSSGDTLTQQNCEEVTTQAWQFHREGGLYAIYNVNTQQYLSYAEAISGAALVFSPYESRKLFRIEVSAAGIYYFYPSDNLDIRFDVWAFSTKPGAKVSFYAPGGGTNQQFYLEQLVDSPDGIPVQLTAVAGETNVYLDWATASQPDYYSVKRSTSIDGPYTTLGTVTSSHYTDSDVQAGTTYYYVVSATYANEETANSTAVSATTTEGLQEAHYWPFDEGTGSLATDVWGGKTATLGTGAFWTNGYTGKGVRLNGSSNITLDTGMVSTLTDFTISTWVNLTQMANWTRIWDFGTGTDNFMFLSASDGDGARFGIRTPETPLQVIDGTSLTVGEWYNVTVTLSGKQGILYINGLEVGRNDSITLSPAALGTTTQNYIGQSQFNDPKLNGVVDDFRIYAKALTPAEITAMVAKAEERTEPVAASNLKSEEATLETAVVYPNPSPTTFTIEAIGDFHFEVYDHVGTLKESGDGNKQSRIGKSLIPGLYLIKIIKGNEAQLIRVIKE